MRPPAADPAGVHHLPLYYARNLCHYTVAQKAAQGAARYLSTVPQSEMMSETLSREAAARATEIAMPELAELIPDSAITGPTAFCDTELCGELGEGVVPMTTRVRLFFRMNGDPTGLLDFGWGGLRMTGNSTVRFVGN